MQGRCTVECSGSTVKKRQEQQATTILKQASCKNVIAILSKTLDQHQIAPGQPLHSLRVLGVVVTRHVQHDVPQQFDAALPHALRMNLRFSLRGSQS